MTLLRRIGTAPIALAILLTASCMQNVPGPPSCDGVSTGFEFTDTSGEFTRGDAPHTVTFMDGTAERVGILSLYRTGLFSWMVPAGGTGTIVFETPAEQVTLFFRDQSASNAGVLTVFDTMDRVVATFDGSTAFQRVDISVDPSTEDLIDSITLENNGTTGFSVIDDFSFCAVPDEIPG